MYVVVSWVAVSMTWRWDLETELFRRHVHKQNGMGEAVSIGVVGIKHDFVALVGRRATRSSRSDGQQTSADARFEDAPLLALADHVLEVDLLDVAGGNTNVGGVLVVQYTARIVELDKVDPAALAQSRPGALVLRRAMVRDAVVAVPDVVRGGLGGRQAEGGGVVPGLAGIAGDVEGFVGGVVDKKFVLSEAISCGGYIYAGFLLRERNRHIMCHRQFRGTMHADRDVGGAGYWPAVEGSSDRPLHVLSANWLDAPPAG